VTETSSVIRSSEASEPQAGSDLFLGGGSPAPVGGWPLALSDGSQAFLDRVCGGDPLSELVVLQGALALVFHRYGASPVEFAGPSVGAGRDARAEDGFIHFRYDMDECMNGREWLLQSQQIAESAYEREPASVRPDSVIALVRDRRVHGANVGDGPDCLVFRFGDDGKGQYRLDDPQGVLPEGFPVLLAGHLDAILDGLARLEVEIGDIPMCGTSEREELARFGQGGPPRAPGATLAGLFRHMAAKTPQAAALISPSRTYTYAELEAVALQLAGHLTSRFAIGSGARVAIAATRSSETVIAFLGVLLSGGSVVPFDPAAPTEFISDILAQSAARAVLVPPSRVDLAFDLPDASVICPALEAAGWGTVPGDALRLPAPDDLAAIYFTSGSEGRPKGVLLGHEGLANTVVDHVQQMEVGSGDRCLMFMAPFFDGGLLDIFTPLAAGATLICPADGALQDPAAFLAFLRENRVSLLTVTPPFLAMLAPETLPDLRVAISAAEPARARDFQRLAGKLSLFNGYGPTEASVNTSLYYVAPDFAAARVPIGRPSAGKFVEIVDPLGRAVPRGVIGEMVIRGTGLAQGYLGAAAYDTGGFSTGPDGLRHYHSGDLAAWDSEGQLHYLGRRDEQVKIGGRRVELGQIERALFAIDLVEEAAVILTKGRLQGFFVQADREYAGIEDAVRRALESKLPGYMIPAELHAIESISRKPNGKVDPSALDRQAQAIRTAQAAFRVTSPTEAVLLDVWREALQIEDVDEDADFFRLGGDSIRMIQAVHSLRERGFEVDVLDLLDHRTLQSLARALDHRTAGQAPIVIQGELALSTAQRARLPAGWEHAFPVSGMQLLMLRWAEDPLALEDGVYHCLARWRVRDEGLSGHALSLAAEALVRRHPILRTGFAIIDDGSIVQVELPEAAFDLKVSDLSALSKNQRLARAAEIFAGEREHRFRPGQCSGPFARLHLVLLGEEAFELILAAHHAVMDGWSSILLENDFVAFYTAAKQGVLELAEVTPGPSYREFVAEDVRAGQSSAALAFWRERWRRAAPVPAPQIVAGEDRALFARKDVKIPEALASALAALGRAQGIRPKTACLAAFAAALAQGNGKPPPIGVVVNGRSTQLSDPLGATGLFWNVAPFVLASSPRLDTVQAELDAMAPFETYPLARMLAEAGRDHLFDVCFNFIQMHHAKSGFGGLEEVGFEAVDRFHYAFTLFVDYDPATFPARCDLRLEYRRDRLADEDADRLVSRFVDELANVLEMAQIS